MTVFYTSQYLNGIEMYYLVDGGVMRYIMHYKDNEGKDEDEK